MADEKDFLEEMIDVWTEKDPSFRARLESAWEQRELLRALANRREELGLSQTEVAARMGTSQSTLARLEQGSANPTLATVARLAKALGKKIEWRLIDEESPNKEPAA
ncbi:MAG TPA: helix-turn-helix transcriptional regulator [Ktedonobacterales bacterium]|jgi:DNA-binding XRE family transcriptional regulator